MFRSWFLSAVTVSALAACGGVIPKPDDLKPPPPPLNLIADALGEIAFHATLSLYKELPERTEAKAAAERVLAKLTGATPLAIPFKVHIVDSKDTDVTVFPGGGILIPRGLLDCPADRLPPDKAPKKAKRKDKSKDKTAQCELAGTFQKSVSLERVLTPALSHEMAHLLELHFLKRLETNGRVVLDAAIDHVMRAGLKNPKLLEDPKAVLALLKDLTFGKDALSVLIGVAGVTVAGETVGHPFLPLQEAEADCRSVTLMNAAKLDPDDAVRFWRENPSKSGTLITSHPRAAERSQKLQACVDQLTLDKNADTWLAARRP